MSQDSSSTSDGSEKSFFSRLIPVVPLKLALVSLTIAFSSMFQYGYASSYINTAQTNFINYLNQSVVKRYDVQLSGSSISWIWSAIVNSDQVGFVVGTLLIPFFSEKYGRRWCLLMSIIPEIFGISISAVAIPLMMPTLLGIGRFVSSIGVGISCSAVTLFLQETSPTHIRGFVSSFQELAACISCVVGMVLGLPVLLGSPDRLSYLIVVGIFGACPRLVLIICPDSPKYLLLRNHDLKKASASIEFYHGQDADVGSVLTELYKEGKLESEDDRFDENGDKKKVSKLKRLWSDKHIRKAIIIGIVVFLTIEATGIVPIYEYSTYILEDAGLSQTLSEFGTLLMAICNTISTVFSILVVEQFGRRKLLLVGLLGIIGCLSSLTLFEILYKSCGVTWAGYGSMVSVICHAVIFSIGPGPISWFVTSELVPQHVRSSVQAFTQLWNMVANLCVSFIFFPLFTAIGAYSFIILCILPTVVCSLYLYFELPETKNREIADVVNELKQQQQKKKEKNSKTVLKY